jgi:hypothetical protein
MDGLKRVLKTSLRPLTERLKPLPFRTTNLQHPLKHISFKISFNTVDLDGGVCSA